MATVSEFYGSRTDGVNLYRTIDAVVNENGEPVRDENGNLIPTGLMIRKVGTDEIYGEAIDVDGSGFLYEETDIPIDGETGEATEEDLYNALAELGVAEDEENNA